MSRPRTTSVPHWMLMKRSIHPASALGYWKTIGTPCEEQEHELSGVCGNPRRDRHDLFDGAQTAHFMRA